MKKLLQILKKMTQGTLTQRNYLIAGIVIAVLSFILVGTLTMGSIESYFFDQERYTLFIVGVSAAIATIVIDIKRIRDILASRPQKEVYTAALVLNALSFLLPAFGTVKFIVLVVLDSNFCQSTFYQENIKEILRKLSLKVAQVLGLS